jgi:hypothetical protein
MLDRLRQMLSQPGFSALLALLGLLAVNWPFTEAARAAGDFALFLYFFGLWSGLVLIAFVLSGALAGQRNDDDV